MPTSAKVAEETSTRPAGSFAEKSRKRSARWSRRGRRHPWVRFAKSRDRSTYVNPGKPASTGVNRRRAVPRMGGGDPTEEPVVTVIRTIAQRPALYAVALDDVAG